MGFKRNLKGFTIIMHETHNPNYKHATHYVNLNISKFVPYHYLSKIKCKQQVFWYFDSYHIQTISGWK